MRPFLAVFFVWVMGGSVWSLPTVGELGTRTDLEGLQQLTLAFGREKDQGARMKAASVWVQYRHPQAWPLYLEAYRREKDANVRAHLVKAMGLRQAPETYDFLFQLFRDAVAPMSMMEAASEALAELTRPQKGSEWPFPPEGVTLIGSGLKADWPAKVKRGILGTLTNLRMEAALQFVMEFALKSGNPEEIHLRAAAVNHLSRSPDPRTFGVFRTLLLDGKENPVVRKTALGALMFSGDAETPALLMTLLRGHHPLSDEDKIMLASVVYFRIQQGIDPLSPEMCEALAKFADGPFENQKAPEIVFTALALGNPADVAVSIGRLAREGAAYAVRCQALETLRKLDEASSTESIEGVMKSHVDPRTRAFAVGQLAQCRDRRVGDWLRAATKDPEPLVREAAAWQLKARGEGSDPFFKPGRGQE